MPDIGLGDADGRLLADTGRIGCGCILLARGGGRGGGWSGGRDGGLVTGVTDVSAVLLVLAVE